MRLLSRIAARLRRPSRPLIASMGAAVIPSRLLLWGAGGMVARSMGFGWAIAIAAVAATMDTWITVLMIHSI